MKLKTKFPIKPKVPIKLSRWLSPVMVLTATMALTPICPLLAGSLLLAPTRLMFEGGTRAQELTIMNRSDTIQTYRLRLEDRRIKENGEYEVISDPADPLAGSPMLRLSARQVTIPPQESATVRVLLRKPAGIGSGEVRSHLIVSELPTVAPPAVGSAGGEALSVTITTIFGISIPVMVRSGETSARLSIPSVKLVNVPDQPNLDNIQMRLETTGNRSMFVDLKVVPARQRRSLPVAEARGVSIYNPVNARDFVLSLNPEQTARMRSGAYVVTFQEVNKDGLAIGQSGEVAF
jgi:P pilus assembly chaperone PapD